MVENVLFHTLALLTTLMYPLHQTLFHKVNDGVQFNLHHFTE